ncbi:MAG: glycosyltransferase family 1 protein [Lachnospiraceae bacterium]|nr:glycosyltransferase family 1 protein [Lachnospiraceae bacterium]
MSALNVLQVIGELELGGAESRIMDITRRLDPERCHYDFLVFNPKEQHYDREAESLGCRIFRLSPRFKLYNWSAYRKALESFFEEHPEIDIVQGHMTSSARIYLKAAKKKGIKCTIAHARSAGTDPGLKGLITRFMRLGLAKTADELFACSKEAAIAVYGRKAYEAGKVRIIPNALELDKFSPAAEDKEKTAALRESLGLKGAYVVGHVGRFHYAKNHEFLLEVFAKIKEKKPEAKLLLVGGGSRESFIREEVSKRGLEAEVIFAGMQSDTAPYYGLMDVLVFPSRYEGLPGTVVEAQAAGVPCIMSDSVTDEVAVTGLVKTLSLSESSEVWAKAALETLRVKSGDNAENIELLKQAGFDVASQTQMLTDLYERLAGKK